MSSVRCPDSAASHATIPPPPPPPLPRSFLFLKREHECTRGKQALFFSYRHARAQIHLHLHIHIHRYTQQHQLMLTSSLLSPISFTQPIYFSLAPPLISFRSFPLPPLILFLSLSPAFSLPLPPPLRLPGRGRAAPHTSTPRGTLPAPTGMAVGVGRHGGCFAPATSLLLPPFSTLPPPLLLSLYSSPSLSPFFPFVFSS